MAKIPPPTTKSRKGAPPAPAKTVANLDKPETGPLAALNLKVPTDFKRGLKSYAALQGKSMTDLLMEGYELLREQRG